MDSAGKAQSVTPHVELTPAWDDEIEYQRLAEACTLSRTGQPSKAREIALAMLEIAEHNDDPRLKARCSIDIAWYSFQLGQAEQAYSYAYRAVEFWKNQNSPRDEAEARSIAGWLLLELWHVEEATEEVMQALALAETCGDVQIHCLALNVVGLMFRATKQPKESIDFCRRAVVLARDIGDPVLLGRWLINLGCAHALAARCSSKVNASFSAAEFKIALALLDEAVALAKANGVSVLAVDPASEGKAPELANLSHDDMQVVTLWTLTPERVAAPAREVKISAARYVAPEAQAANAPANRPAILKQLPHTASLLPWVVMLGMLASFCACLLRIRRGVEA